MREIDPAMKLETYTATKGLERFSEAERFQIYRATHKRLLRENAAYRRSYQCRFSALVAAIILPLGLLQILGKSMGESVTAILLFVLLLIGHVFLTLYASLRLQHYMNRQVEGILLPPSLPDL